jgi:hypothetical protein
MYDEPKKNRKNSDSPSGGFEGKAMKQKKVEIVQLRPDSVLVDRDHAVQRGLIDSHVKSIAKCYTTALFGLGHVSLREDGEYYLMDGQHRCAAAIVAGQGHVTVPFQVWRDLTVQQEADMFLKLQERRKAVRAIDMFKVGVEAQNPACVEVKRICKTFGLTVGMGANDGMVASVNALLDLYEGKVSGVERKDKHKAQARLPQSHLLTRSLEILTKAWGRDRNAFDGTLLKSVGALVFKHDAAIDTTRLARCLAKRDSPERALGKIKALKEAARVSAVTAGIQYLEGVYNVKLAEDRKLK